MAGFCFRRSSSFSFDPVGIGLRYPYYQQILDERPSVGWLEVHPENYFGGGLHRHFLKEVSEHYPISLHAVGLSLGSVHPVSKDHLDKIRDLIELVDPIAVSDHASWSASGNAHLNDLLPLPYNRETLDALCRNIDRTQEYLGFSILIENPSTYIAFRDNEMCEAAFMNEAARKTGCGLLLDINNIYVQSRNHGLDPFEYIDVIEGEKVGEMHLAGHTERPAGDGVIVVDTHNRPVRDEVWDLYTHAVRRFGCVPTLIEWDQDYPALEILVAEAKKARQILLSMSEEASHAAE
ncbi:MAG: DUF692 domain-containing protein [Alphaproteobacteria bacterium]|nr:DUF692 domain-containing protein [Alphaproteobacteria bacterium]MCB9974308.1 DUF692 domain-containing protein [Rhodospirillales bacterium]